MKTLHKILATLLLGAACSGCDLTLIPEDKVTPQTYFQSEVDLRLWTNQFYTLLDSPDSASGLNADDMVDKSMGDVISGTRMASDESGWTWTSLRKINYYLQNSHNCTDEAARTKYDGVAYFFRAYFYYVKVRRYGDAIAVVAAETPEIVQEAMQLIEVEYEELPVINGEHNFAPATAETPTSPDRLTIYRTARDFLLRHVRR